MAKGDDDKEINLEKQTRLANLGKLIDTIHKSVPDLLTTSFPRHIVSDDITLNFLPDSHPHIPSIVGRGPYTTTIKLLQFLVTTLLIPPSSKLQILFARTDSLSGITRHSFYHTQPRKRKDPDQLSAHSNLLQPKIAKPSRFIVHWRTVSPEVLEDQHVQKQPESPDSPQFFPYSWSSSLAKLEPSQLARTIGILPHEYPVLTGIFEFEFDDECREIITHTITDLEYLTNELDHKSAIGTA